MRRSVLLAVWLSLVLSLSKGTTVQASNTTTVTTTTTSAGTTAQASNTTTVPTTSTPAEHTTSTPVITTITPSTTVTTTSTSPGTTAQASNTTTVSTTSTPAAEHTTSTPVNTAITPSTTVTTTSTSPGTTAQASNTTTITTTSTPAENTTSTPVITTITPSTTVTTASTSPGTTAQASNTTTVPTTSTPAVVDFCRGDPCGKSLAKCISLNSNYTCECPYGFYYENQNCSRGKVFPATIEVRASYSDSVKNVSSAEYEEVFHNVSEFFRKAFKELDGYMETVIVKIQLPKETRSSLPLNVTVTNLFTWSSAVNDESVNSAAAKAAGDQSYVSLYKVAQHCAVYGCDTETTVCHEDMFPECRCKIGLERTDNHSCSACSKNCSAEAQRYCVVEKGVPACKCTTNFQEKGENCVPCLVGYSGDNCTDNTGLILIIVGTVLGATILSLVIAVTIISVRAKRNQSPEKRSLIKPGYSDLDTSDDRPTMFPRVQTTSGHANPGYQPNNPYEMTSNRGHFPERDYDDLFEASREPRGFRMQSRY